jgi:hypothetical protein
VLGDGVCGPLLRFLRRCVGGGGCGCVGGCGGAMVVSCVLVVWSTALCLRFACLLRGSACSDPVATIGVGLGVSLGRLARRLRLRLINDPCSCCRVARGVPV